MPNKYPKNVKIIEVGPRDGLQNEPSLVSLIDKKKLVTNLINSGLKDIEVGSFVSPKWVPQMADSAELINAISPTKQYDLNLSALVPNIKGLESAMNTNINSIAIFASASETFSQKNINCSIDESLERFSDVLKKISASNLPVRGYVSCAFGCPYEGDVHHQKVIELTKKLLELGCYEVSIADTIGCGTPSETDSLLHGLIAAVGREAIAMHFHDTHGRALENIEIALSKGISSIDSAVAGLGGCPYAPGASGNVATEDVVNLLNDLNIKHGIDLQKLIASGNEISQALGRRNSARVLQQKEAPSQGLFPIDFDSNDA